MTNTIAQPTMLQETTHQKIARAAVAYSGGVNATLSVLLARELYQAATITAIIVDVGQDGVTSQAAHAAALDLGCTPLVVDVRHEYHEVWLKKALAANAAGCARSLARQLIAAVVAQQAATLGCDAIVTGATDGATSAALTPIYERLAPGVRVLAPLTESGLSTMELAALRGRFTSPGVAITPAPPVMSETTQPALTVTFEAGAPVRLNGVPATLGETLAAFQPVGGLAALVNLHRDLEASGLAPAQLAEKRRLEQQWAALVCPGGWYQPQRRQLDAALARFQRGLDGEYTLTANGVGLPTAAETRALNRVPAA